MEQIIRSTSPIDVNLAASLIGEAKSAAFKSRAIGIGAAGLALSLGAAAILWAHNQSVDPKMLKAALGQSASVGLDRADTFVSSILRGRVRDALDPNHSRTQAESPEGIVLVPLAVCGKKTTIHQNASTPLVSRGRRSGPRELLLEVQASHPQNLTIWTECLVTQLVFDAADSTRVVGVKLK